MYISILETLTAALPGSSTFTSQVVDLPPEKKLVVSVNTDKSGTVYIEQSSDGTTWSTVSTVVLEPNIAIKIWIDVTQPHGRVRLVNSTAAQGYLKLFVATTNESLLIS